jgi:hypothetical protein
VQSSVFECRESVLGPERAGLYLLLRDRREMGEVSPEDASAVREDEEQAVVCRDCGHAITSVRAVVAVDGSCNHTYFNPAGIVFEIVCFSRAPGCAVQGPSSSEFSWFPGFAWRPAFCGGCFAHVGWRFESADSTFFGLIRNRLAGDI